MATFFSDFPTVDLRYSNEDNAIVSYTDLFRFIDVNDVILKDYSNYEWYEIKDGDRPDLISQELYGTPNFYWTFFIINDRLKNGMKEWPLTQQTLDKYVKEKYSKYAVTSVFPFFFLSSNDLMETFWNLDMMGFDINVDLMDDIEFPIAIANFLQGLDLTYENLYVRRLWSGFDALIDQETALGANLQDDAFIRGYAKIKHFDRDRYQVWYDLDETSDSFFFEDPKSTDTSDASLIQLVLINPYATYNPADPSEPIILNQTLYDETVQKNEQWIEEQRDWYEQFFGTYNGDQFSTDLFEKLQFYVSNFYEDGSLAPDYFLDVTTGEKLCTLFCNINGTGLPVPNFESERTINDEKRFIRVLRKEVIYRFVEKYKEVLNASGRLAL
jgi:hypothetical protein